jgi:hypothetical protein
MNSLASGKDNNQVYFSSYQWKKRLLILFAPAEDDPIYRSFEEQLQKRIQEIRDRDLLTFHVLESGEGRLDDLPLNEGQVLSLSRRFSIKIGQLKLILIGKDGKVKFRRESPIELLDIFSVINAMPMSHSAIQEK